MQDNQGRKIDYLRISLTDRCNLRCKYCMPPEGVPLMCHEDILTYEEILKIVKASALLGVKKIRLTGGEPLLRKNICYLIREINKVQGIEDIAITTNGLLLDKMLDELVEAGLKRINLSLDTLDEDTFQKLTGSPGVEIIKKGLQRAIEKGLKVKINAVPLKEYNDKELIELIKLTLKWDIDVRFIELMPIGCGKNFDAIYSTQIIDMIKKAGYELKELPTVKSNGPATYYQIEGAKGKVGFISPLSHNFCSQCNRVRLTAEGYLKLCLHSKAGLDLKSLLRQGMDMETLVEIMGEAVKIKPVQHYFHEEDKEQDKRSMNQIGG